MAVLELPAVKSYLNVSNGIDNSEVQDFIDAAVAAIEAIVGPIEVTDPITVKIRPTQYAGLILPQLPVAELVSVTPYAGTALDLAGFDLDQQSGLVTYAVGTSTPRFTAQSYTVVYKAGRDPVPADLKMAVKELVRHLWLTQRGSGNARPRPDANVNSAVPGAAYTFPIRVEQLLAPYTFIGFA